MAPVADCSLSLFQLATLNRIPQLRLVIVALLRSWSGLQNVVLVTLCCVILVALFTCTLWQNSFRNACVDPSTLKPVSTDLGWPYLCSRPLNDLQDPRTRKRLAEEHLSTSNGKPPHHSLDWCVFPSTSVTGLSHVCAYELHGTECPSGSVCWNIGTSPDSDHVRFDTVFLSMMMVFQVGNRG